MLFFVSIPLCVLCALCGKYHTEHQRDRALPGYATTPPGDGHCLEVYFPAALRDEVLIILEKTPPFPPRETGSR